MRLVRLMLIELSNLYELKPESIEEANKLIYQGSTYDEAVGVIETLNESIMRISTYKRKKKKVRKSRLKTKRKVLKRKSKKKREKLNL